MDLDQAASGCKSSRWDWGGYKKVRSEEWIARRRRSCVLDYSVWLFELRKRGIELRETVG